MTQTVLNAGGVSDSSSLQGGNDGTLVLQVGPSTAKVNALSFGADGTPTFLKSGMVFGAAQPTTAGTAVTFGSIPAWAKRITLDLVGVSTSGTSEIQFRLGSSAGVAAAGYLGASTFLATSSTGTANYTTGFGAYNSVSAGSVRHGRFVFELSLTGANTWTCSGGFAESQSALQVITHGSIALAAALNQVVLTTVNGTDTFDAGGVSILYEG